jgi:hypothetical protein
MPLLNRGGAGFGRAIPTQAPFGEVDTSQPVGAAMKTGLFEACANLNCRTGWLHLWRNRSVPVFENGWTCSPACTAVRVTAAVNRELDGRGYAGESHRHRIPLGLVMLEQGWITQTQLRRALEAQKAARTGRLGEWLVRQRAVSEATVTRALGLQWSCPVLPLELHDAAAMTVAMPRLFVDAFGALPLRLAGGRVLYLGFEERLDPVLALAMERMTGLQVECGMVRESLFRPAHARILDAKFPGVELVEAVSEPAAAHALARSVERTRPIASRLVRVHDCLWLRMWLSPQTGPLPETGSVLDLVCSIGIP